MKIVGIIQARLGSTRLPRKVLMDICGKPMLWHVLNRLSKTSLDDIIVATTTNVTDLPIVSMCKDWGFKVYQGSELDVVSRYYETAKEHNAETIVRITSDCPCIDPVIVDQTISYYLYCGLDYVTFGNVARPFVPEYADGFDVEVFSFSTLETAHKYSKNREHVGVYMHQYCSYGYLPFNSELPVKLSVDTMEDLENVRSVFSALGNDFGINDVIQFLRRKNESNQ